MKLTGPNHSKDLRRTMHSRKIVRQITDTATAIVTKLLYFILAAWTFCSCFGFLFITFCIVGYLVTVFDDLVGTAGAPHPIPFRTRP